MAIVDSPLLSLGARGTIAKTLTFLRLKGQNVVRQRVIPLNPQSAGQTTQRGFLAAAVASWQAGGFNALDIAAWARYAKASFRKMSGYNIFTSLFTKYLVGGGTEDPPFGAVTSILGDEEFTITIGAKSGGTMKLFIGTTKTSQPTEHSVTDMTGDSFEEVIDGLTASTTYFYYLQYTDATAHVLRGGLYTIVTTA